MTEDLFEFYQTGGSTDVETGELAKIMMSAEVVRPSFKVFHLLIFDPGNDISQKNREEPD